MVSSKQYMGEPLSCFCPAHFSGSWSEYTNNICMMSKAFYVPVDTSFSWQSATPKYIELNNQQKTNNSHIKFVRVDNFMVYYPFLLLIQAIFFYLPYL
jgi:innexin